MSDETRTSGSVRWLRVVVSNGLLAVLLFGGAGTFAWTAGWLVLALTWASGAVGALTLARHPRGDAAAPRLETSRAGSAIPWVSLMIWAIAGWQANAAGIPEAGAGSAAGFVLAAIAAGWNNWAMASNPRYSGSAPMSGQDVLDAGPYSWTRHPGAAGVAGHAWGIALALGGGWALAPAAVVSGLAAAAAIDEEARLREAEPRYGAYAERVRARFVPGLF